MPMVGALKIMTGSPAAMARLHAWHLPRGLPAIVARRGPDAVLDGERAACATRLGEGRHRRGRVVQVDEFAATLATVVGS